MHLSRLDKLYNIISPHYNVDVEKRKRFQIIVRGKLGIGGTKEYVYLVSHILYWILKRINILSVDEMIKELLNTESNRLLASDTYPPLHKRYSLLSSSDKAIYKQYEAITVKLLIENIATKQSGSNRVAFLDTLLALYNRWMAIYGKSIVKDDVILFIKGLQNDARNKEAEDDIASSANKTLRPAADSPTYLRLSSRITNPDNFIEQLSSFVIEHHFISPNDKEHFKRIFTSHPPSTKIRITAARTAFGIFMKNLRPLLDTTEYVRICTMYLLDKNGKSLQNLRKDAQNAQKYSAQHYSFITDFIKRLEEQYPPKKL